MSHITIYRPIIGGDRLVFFQYYIYIYIYAFSRRFYPKRLTVHSGYTFFYQYVCSLGILGGHVPPKVYGGYAHVCVPWESNPQSFALLTQCSNH